MNDFESLLRASRPEPLKPGEHRKELARLLRERQSPAPPIQTWSFSQYALAFSVALFCLGLAILIQPRKTVSPNWAERQEILSGFPLAETNMPPHPIRAERTTPLAPRLWALLAPAPRNADYAKIWQENRRELDELMAKMK